MLGETQLILELVLHILALSPQGMLLKSSLRNVAFIGELYTRAPAGHVFNGV